LQEQSLRNLLESCCDSRDARRESGWAEFLRRYKRYIYQVAAGTCASWSASRLRKQLSETIDDIVSDVLLLLCQNQGRVLSEFRSRDDERLFLAWLATICRRKSSRHILRFFSSKMVEMEAGELPGLFSPLDCDRRAELYEHFVEHFRSSAARNKIHLERDIFIFHMRVWADFSADMIQRMPCLDGIGHRVVDNTVNRMRKVLRLAEAVTVER
jgi:hypothetical protein